VDKSNNNIPIAACSDVMYCTYCSGMPCMTGTSADYTLACTDLIASQLSIPQQYGYANLIRHISDIGVQEDFY
jgi:hypothetical protein